MISITLLHSYYGHGLWRKLALNCHYLKIKFY